MRVTKKTMIWDTSFREFPRCYHTIIISTINFLEKRVSVLARYVELLEIDPTLNLGCCFLPCNVVFGQFCQECHIHSANHRRGQKAAGLSNEDGRAAEGKAFGESFTLDDFGLNRTRVRFE